MPSPYDEASDITRTDQEGGATPCLPFEPIQMLAAAGVRLLTKAATTTTREAAREGLMVLEVDPADLDVLTTENARCSPGSFLPAFSPLVMSAHLPGPLTPLGHLTLPTPPPILAVSTPPTTLEH